MDDNDMMFNGLDSGNLKPWDALAGLDMPSMPQAVQHDMACPSVNTKLEHPGQDEGLFLAPTADGTDYLNRLDADDLQDLFGPDWDFSNLSSANVNRGMDEVGKADGPSSVPNLLPSTTAQLLPQVHMVASSLSARHLTTPTTQKPSNSAFLAPPETSFGTSPGIGQDAFTLPISAPCVESVTQTLRTASIEDTNQQELKQSKGTPLNLSRFAHAVTTLGPVLLSECGSAPVRGSLLALDLPPVSAYSEMLKDAHCSKRNRSVREQVTFKEYEDKYGCAAKCQTGDCAEYLSRPCDGHTCTGCKLNRRLTGSKSSKLCGPCTRREIVSGLKFDECNICKQQMLYAVYTNHANQHKDKPDGTVARTHLSITSGCYCKGCSLMRPLSYYHQTEQPTAFSTLMRSTCKKCQADDEKKKQAETAGVVASTPDARVIKALENAMKAAKKLKCPAAKMIQKCGAGQVTAALQALQRIVELSDEIENAANAVLGVPTEGDAGGSS